MEDLKSLNIFSKDLNYNIVFYSIRIITFYIQEFSEIYLDKKINPLALACFQGNIDMLKQILANKTTDIDF